MTYIIIIVLLMTALVSVKNGSYPAWSIAVIALVAIIVGLYVTTIT